MNTINILDRLIAFPTVSKDSNLELIEWVHGLLKDAGFCVTKILSADGRKAGLFARIGPAVAGGICLSAHTDVVPVEGQEWSYPPFKLTQTKDRVFGRGTTDMKGFLASALCMALRAGQTPLKEPLSLSISYDEEIGCVGIAEMMPVLAPIIGTPRLVIVGEPTSMQLGVGHKGKTALRVSCQGQAGHSALAPNFTNAIHVAAEFIQDIRKLQIDLAEGPLDAGYSVPYSTVHIGKISGGRALNIVPDAAEILMEIRHLGPAQDHIIRARIHEIAQQVQDRIGGAAGLTIKDVNSYPGLDATAEGSAFELMQRIAGNVGVCKLPFGTEAGYFHELGLPVFVMGPGEMEKDGHQPDEGLDRTELSKCDRFMDRVLSKLQAG